MAQGPQAAALHPLPPPHGVANPLHCSLQTNYYLSESFIFDPFGSHSSLTLSRHSLISCCLFIRRMAASQGEVTVRWSGQLSMKDDFLVVWSAGLSGFLGRGSEHKVTGDGRS